jgi:hypothetical protein
MSAAPFFSFDDERRTVETLPHGVEVVAVVYYRTAPDQPRGAMERTFSSIGPNEAIANYWCGRQVGEWFTKMTGEG